MDAGGRVLVSQRPRGKAMAGFWEFPGGKLEVNELRFDSLARELREELNIEVDSARPLIRYRHQYAEFEVDLDVWRVSRWRGQIEPREGQALRWCGVADLQEIGLLPADTQITTALRLPDTIAVTPAVAISDAKLLDMLERADLLGGLICLRRPGADTRSLLALLAGACCRLEATGARLLLHGDPVEWMSALDALPPALFLRLREVVAGIHAPVRYLTHSSVRLLQPELFLGASCHNAEELERAIEFGATYAFLGNVLETPSHPGQPGMGWQRFEELVRDLPLPVYAIGGLGPEDLETAWARGAQGIAAIRSLWPKN
ncbi:Nudix family hydrolase [Thioalkalivibrio sp. XN279]|nr:Nudix family hydrolase [Thioalkalivibrio sp. XN279]